MKTVSLIHIKIPPGKQGAIQVVEFPLQRRKVRRTIAQIDIRLSLQ
jgi:hypothetical protein